MQEDSIQLEPSPALIKAIRRILFSLTHFFLKVGITFPLLSEILKEVYVDVANTHFRLDNKKQTQTRLSFITGVHRKDVKRLLALHEDDDEPKNVSVGVRIISKWLTDLRFLDDFRQPLALPLKSKSESSFEELIEAICKQDIRPRVILDEWLQLGVVKFTKENKVQLVTSAFIPQKGLDEKSFFLGQNISDHFQAASSNLLNDSPKFFERCVYYEGLSEKSISKLKKMVDEQGMEMLIKINERANQLKKEEPKENIPTHRFNVGVYLFSEDKIRKEDVEYE